MITNFNMKKLKESMKFIMERSTEPFKFKEGSDYEVLYDDKLDKYGLLVDGYLFCFLTKDQAKTLSENIKNKEIFEKFFNSVGIGDEWLNLQPKAACDPNYERPTGNLEERFNEIERELNEALNLDEEKLEEGQKLKAAILTAILAIGAISPSFAKSAKSIKRENLPPEQKIEKACDSLKTKYGSKICIEDDDFGELKNALEEAGIVNEFGRAGLRELCETLRDNGITLVNEDGTNILTPSGSLFRSL